MVLATACGPDDVAGDGSTGSSGTTAGSSGVGNATTDDGVDTTATPTGDGSSDSSTGEPPALCEPGCAVQMVEQWAYLSADPRALQGLTALADGSVAVVERTAFGKAGQSSALVLTTLSADGLPQGTTTVQDPCEACFSVAFATQSETPGHVRLVAAQQMGADLLPFVAQIDLVAMDVVWIDSWVMPRRIGSASPLGSLVSLAGETSIVPVRVQADLVDLVHHDATGMRTVATSFAVEPSLLGSAARPAVRTSTALAVGSVETDDVEGGRVRVLDTATFQPTHEVELDGAPQGLGALPDGGWVAAYGTGVPGGMETTVHVVAHDVDGAPSWTSQFVVPNQGTTHYLGVLPDTDGTMVVWIRHSYEFTQGMAIEPIPVTTYVGLDAQGQQQWMQELDVGEVSWPGLDPSLSRTPSGAVLVGDTVQVPAARVRSLVPECVCR